MIVVPALRCYVILSLQGGGWKVVASFEGNFPNRIKQLPLDRHFDINNVKRVGLFFLLVSSFKLHLTRNVFHIYIRVTFPFADLIE